MALDIKWIGGQSPVQAEGTIDDREFYFRARGRGWSMEIAQPGKSVHADDRWIMRRPYGNGPYDAGYMSDNEAREFIEQAILVWRDGSPNTIEWADDEIAKQVEMQAMITRMQNDPHYIETVATDRPSFAGEIARSAMFELEETSDGWRRLGAYATNDLAAGYRTVPASELPGRLRKSISLTELGEIHRAGGDYVTIIPSCASNEDGSITAAWWTGGNTVLHIQVGETVLVNNDAQKTYGWEVFI